MRARFAPRFLLGVALVAAAGGLRAAPSDPGGLPPVEIKDLHYGDVLFYFFQDRYFEALVRTEAYTAQGHLKPHAADAELLLGGLYLSFGQHVRAAEIFRKLLADPATPPGVRDRAWFHLGKVLYARGRYDESEDALRRAGSSLPAGLAAERALLLAEGLMHRGRYPQAVAELRGLAGPADWRAFAQFNLGVALLRSGQADQGYALLDEVGQGSSASEEMRALRDKANVALGYAYLQAGRSVDAASVLQRVRLDGPESSKALLAAGWADSAQGRFADALVPWSELRGRSLLDPAVQESLLAVPYAYASLSADRQAAQYYESAIDAYQRETQRLDESIASIRDGRMLKAVLAADRGTGQGWFWQLATLPDAPESRYLYHLLAGNRFQEALKDYRDLDFLDRNLTRWAGSLGVFADMVETRRRAYEQRLPGAAGRLGQVDIEVLDARRDALHARFDAAARSGDWTGLATGDELRTLARINSVESELAGRAGDPAFADARDSLRLARGVLLWRLAATARERTWTTGRDLRQLDAQLFIARTHLRAVTDAMKSVPARNAAFAARIAELGPRVEALRQRLAVVRQRQGEYLAELAVSELEAQKARLAEYSVQARYALAALYDRAAAPQARPPVTRPASGAATGGGP